LRWGTFGSEWGSASRGARARLLVALAVALAILIPAAALAVSGAEFPGQDPHESPRLNTPNDPEFDRCEADDQDTAQGVPAEPECSSYTQEEFRAFGFSPDSANELPPGGPHYTTGTKYKDCPATPAGGTPQLDPQGMDANIKAEKAGNPAGDALAACLQIAGVRTDSALKFSDGDPDVSVAILDTGIRWQSQELVNKVRLNTEELPKPRNDPGTPTAGPGDCTGRVADYDANGDGAVNVLDYACDSRVSKDAGDDEADSILDASDLIATFSKPTFDDGTFAGGVDDDGNGFVDDIAGWDFFDDDNDPYDASSCCSANGHGTGRATEAVGETNNGNAGIGMCPDCQLVPLRVWDTFVVPTDNYAMGVIYAADNGVSVVEGAVGGLTNTQFGRNAFTYADSKGVALTLVSSDINSANHNYPTNYNEAIYVAGSIYDTAPNDTCSGPGGLPGLPDFPSTPGGFGDGCQQFLDFVSAGSGCGQNLPTCINPGDFGQPTTTSFFRNSNLTQYGGKSDIVLMGATGSENTGQASGAAGLLASFGRETFGATDMLSGNEIRQLLTMTAEDVQPENTGQIGLPDKANEGWDPHFGYGRVNLAVAMARIANDRGPAPPKASNEPFAWPCADADTSCIPPEVQIDSPDWYTPINVDRVPAGGIPVEGLAAAPHSDDPDGVGAWELEYACGQDALDSDFKAIPGTPVKGTGPVDGELGKLPKLLLVSLANTCEGEVVNDAGRPAGGDTDGPWPADPYPNPDPERHAFQIRLTVHEATNPDNIGRYRKTLFAYKDDGNLPGWPRAVGKGALADTQTTRSGGEVSPRLYDLNGDNKLDVVQGNSSGELYALKADGTPLPSFNNGQPVVTNRYETELNHPVPAGVSTPHESMRVPAIGDIDGDREPEIVASAGEHVYAWEASGARVQGFPVRIAPALSEPCKPGVPKPCFHPADRAITSTNHIKRGIFGSVALGDLTGDGRLDIVSGSMDQHVYAWDGTGKKLPGFPKQLRSAGADGAEIVASPAIAQLDGRGTPEIVIATNEVIPGDPAFPDSFFDFFGAALRASTGSNPVYALHGNGKPVDGWPVTVPVAAGDVLPLVLPSHDAAVLDDDANGTDEVSVSGGTGVIGAQGAFLVNGNGTTRQNYQTGPGNRTDDGAILNLADYPSIGDLSGTGNPLILKGGLTVNGVANLLAVNQNLPFNHVEQAFDPSTGQSQPGFPRATDDFQLVSQAAVARVSGSGPQTQALVGTGLYQLHAYGPTGMDAAGWPKFTGGWTQTTPAVGDADGDGDLDVSTTTREGWSFLWDTKVPACGGANDEWQSFHHDEFGSANYGTDARPPGTPTGLRATRRANGDIALSFVAPGDDWLCKKADRYEIRVSANPLSGPGDGRLVARHPAEARSGERQADRLAQSDIRDARYAAVLYRDDAGNWGHLASVRLSAGAPPSAAEPCETRIVGTRNADRLIGTALGERFIGRGGRDSISGRRGSDCVNAGSGGDVVRGQRGFDEIDGKMGGDRLRGGRFNDVMRGGNGSDQLSGGPGDDRIQGGAGRDKIGGGASSDALRGGDDRDRIKGGRGGDSINVVGGGFDVVHCGSGSDQVKADRTDRVAKSCERVQRR